MNFGGILSSGPNLKHWKSVKVSVLKICLKKVVDFPKLYRVCVCVLAF